MLMLLIALPLLMLGSDTLGFVVLLGSLGYWLWPMVLKAEREGR
jgi:hypothetical protein